MHHSHTHIQLQGIEAEVYIARKHGSPHLPDVTKWPIREIPNIPKKDDGSVHGIFFTKLYLLSYIY